MKQEHELYPIVLQHYLHFSPKEIQTFLSSHVTQNRTATAHFQRALTIVSLPKAKGYSVRRESRDPGTTHKNQDISFFAQLIPKLWRHKTVKERWFEISTLFLQITHQGEN